MDPAPSLPQTLERLDGLVRRLGVQRSEVLDVRDLATRTALPEDCVRALLRGDPVPEDTVNERVRARIKVLADAYLARTGKRMSDLAGRMERDLGISGVWARSICTGKKVPSVELLHELVRFFKVEGGEGFFTDPAPEALNRALLSVLASLQPVPAEQSDSPMTVLAGDGDVRGLALRQARELSPERWRVLNATLKALLELDEGEEEQ